MKEILDVCSAYPLSNTYIHWQKRSIYMKGMQKKVCAAKLCRKCIEILTEHDSVHKMQNMLHVNPKWKLLRLIFNKSYAKQGGRSAKNKVVFRSYVKNFLFNNNIGKYCILF